MRPSSVLQVLPFRQGNRMELFTSEIPNSWKRFGQAIDADEVGSHQRNDDTCMKCFRNRLAQGRSLWESKSGIRNYRCISSGHCRDRVRYELDWLVFLFLVMSCNYLLFFHTQRWRS